MRADWLSAVSICLVRSVIAAGLEPAECANPNRTVTMANLKIRILRETPAGDTWMLESISHPFEPGARQLAVTPMFPRQRPSTDHVASPGSRVAHPCEQLVQPRPARRTKPGQSPDRDGAWLKGPATQQQVRPAARCRPCLRGVVESEQQVTAAAHTHAGW